MHRIWVFVLVSLGAVPSQGLAQARVPRLSQVSIEDLMAIEVTAAGRKDQRAGDVAAAVFVITHDDIHRSGMTTIPDLLRLVPGVDVAQINASNWAVSVRGFNGRFANKLLVLVDGRSVYNQLFSGVLWDEQNAMLDDIDRIEVIRGPAAAMWGANAVNGVINIVTKAAADTLGGLVRVDVGSSGQQAAVRYGATAGAASYRGYAQWTGGSQSVIEPGTGANDAYRAITTGLRSDWTTRAGTFTLDGGITAGRLRALWLNLDPLTAAVRPVADDVSDARGGHVLGRWTQTRASGASLQIQSFVDIASRREPVADYSRHTVDVEAQYHTRLGARHDVVTGAGYRSRGDHFDETRGASLTPADHHSSLTTAFIQDEIALFGNRLAVTLGSQWQYDSDLGAGVQPTARVMWKMRPSQRLWASTSRALRTPSLSDRGIRIDFPPAPSPAGLPLAFSLVGNPAAETETFVDVEVGYRIELGTTGAIDVTGFAGRYDDLQTEEVTAPTIRSEPPPPVIHAVSQFGNQLEATTRGLELAAHWSPVPAWRLDGSYSVFHLTPNLAATSRDPDAAHESGSAPGVQWQLRSSYSPGSRARLHAAVFHVGPVEQLQVEAYTRADVTVEWRFSSRLSLMAIGQNLLDEAHAEYSGSDALVRATQVPRSASLRLRWTFR